MAEPRIKVDIICSYDQLKLIEDWCVENMGERWSATGVNRNGRWAGFYNMEKTKNKKNEQDIMRYCACYTFSFQEEIDAAWFRLKWG